MEEKAVIKVGEDGAEIKLPNGKVVSLSRDDNSVDGAEAVLGALGIELEYTE